MRNVSHYIINRHQDILRVFIIILSVLLILAWLPEGRKFAYEFSEGMTWQSDDLYAPYSFPILKTQQEISNDRDQKLKKFKNYYVKDPKIVAEQLKKFTAEMEEIKLVDEMLTPLVSFGDSVLRKIYAKGIVQNEIKGTEQINLVINNEVSLAPTKKIYTVDNVKLDINNIIFSQNELLNETAKNIINNCIQANIRYDDELTRNFRKQALAEVLTTKGLVKKEDLIIKRGDAIDPEKYQILASLKTHFEEHSGDEKESQLVTIGYFLLVCMCLSVLLLYIYFYENSIYQSIRSLLFFLSIILIFTFVVGGTLKLSSYFSSQNSIYIVPFCIVPLLVRAFFNTRVALFTLITILLISGFIVPNSFEFVFINLLAGILAGYFNQKIHFRSQYFKASIIILGTYFISYFGLSLVQNGSIESIRWVTFLWLTINVMLTLLAYPLIYLFEKVFGLITEITIFELSELSNPLLKNLSLKAPGTFQHSLQVANLAEAAAREVGCNPLLCKVGALYHDVGKMENPSFFIENQNTNVNPHDDLAFEESAKIIIKHVTDGIELAKKYKLPDIIIDFIRTHHGTSRVEYFYQSFLKNYPDQPISEDEFQYPGPIPFSQETGIVLLADAVEASSRSLKNPVAEDIEKLVDNIVHSKVDNDQLINCDLTYRDVTKIKMLFKKMLKSIYHVRVAYPTE